VITEHKLPLSCVIDETVYLATTVLVGEGTVISGEVEVHEEVQLGRYCVLEGAPGLKTIIGPGTVLEDYVKIHPGVSLGRDSRVESFTVLGHPTKADLMGRDDAQHSERVLDLLVPQAVTVIGPRATIRSHSVIYTHVRIGAALNTGHSIMIREHTRIGDRCVFGTHGSTDGYCRLGDSAHIGQYAQLSQSARIGHGVFIGGHSVFSDNKGAIRDVEDDLFGATIDDYVRVGLGCVILPTVHIGAGAMIGAGSVVTKNVPKQSVAYGNPARVARELSAAELQKYINSVDSH
jgi:acetyltransferase-like isoleucine patch superfamily enzyme